MPRLLKLSQGGPGYTPVLDSVHCTLSVFFMFCDRTEFVLQLPNRMNQQLQRHFAARMFDLIIISYHLHHLTMLGRGGKGKGKGKGKGGTSAPNPLIDPAQNHALVARVVTAESPAERAQKQRKLGRSVRNQLSVKGRDDLSVQDSEDAAAIVAISSFSERAALADVDVLVSDIVASGIDVDLISRATTDEDVRAHSFRY